MYGVTILKEYLCYPDKGYIIMGVILLSLLIPFVILCVISIIESIKEKLKSISIILSSLVVISIVVVSISITHIISLYQNPTKRYEVNVDENVNLIDFTERYKIIEQKDRVYIVEEK